MAIPVHFRHFRLELNIIVTWPIPSKPLAAPPIENGDHRPSKIAEINKARLNAKQIWETLAKLLRQVFKFNWIWRFSLSARIAFCQTLQGWSLRSSMPGLRGSEIIISDPRLFDFSTSPRQLVKTIFGWPMYVHYGAICQIFFGIGGLTPKFCSNSNSIMQSWVARISKVLKSFRLAISAWQLFRIENQSALVIQRLLIIGYLLSYPLSWLWAWQPTTSQKALINPTP